MTKEVIETEKREEQRNREEALRDRTREKMYGKYEEYDQKRTRLDKPQSKPSQNLRMYEEDMLVKEFKSSKEEELEKLRQKRLRREEKERARTEELKPKNGQL